MLSYCEILLKYCEISPLPCNYAKCNRKSIYGAKLEKNHNSSQLYRALHQAGEASMTIGTKQYMKEPLSRSKCTVLVTGTHIASAPCSVRSVACVVLDFCMARSSLTSFKKKKNQGLHCLCSKTLDFLLHCENVNIRLCSRAEQCSGQGALPFHFSAQEQSTNCGHCWEAAGRF